MEDLGEGRPRFPYLQEFNSLIGRIMQIQWKKALTQGLRSYNIKLYNIDKLSPKKVRDLYFHLADKQLMGYRRFSMAEDENEAWHENELRVFIWLLVTYSYVLKKPLTDFSDPEWHYMSGLFCGKNPWLCQFQFMNIRKTPLKNEKWTYEEDQLLTSILNSDVQKNRWNEIAKLLFYNSNRFYFRTAKQCRERWNNYLDPSKFRGVWSSHEDLVLISYVAREGKKWAQIAKALEGRRTQHMVKNRFKSLMTKQTKLMKQEENPAEESILNLVLRKLTGEVKVEAPILPAESMKIQEPETDAAVQNTLKSPKKQPEQPEEYDDHALLLRSPIYGILKEYDSEHIEFQNRGGFLLNEEGELWSGRNRNAYLNYFGEEHDL